MALPMEPVVGLFPGQGGYKSGCLAGLRGDEAARAVTDTVDEIAAETLGRRLADFLASDRGEHELFAADPDMLQVATFATSVAVFEALRSRGAIVQVLMGHSLGEIAALVCSGALTVAEGTRIVLHRIAALREFDTSGGAMVALACDRDRATQITNLLAAADVTVAVDNGPSQTVLSGTDDALRRIEQISAAIGINATRLRSPHPFHNALLEPARRAFAERIAGHRAQAMGIPVFSPILGRYYRERDDLADLLASHLVTPVTFAGSIKRAHDAGARIWVEMGAGGTLTHLVRSAHPGSTVFTPLRGKGSPLEDAAIFLGGVARTDLAAPSAPATSTVPMAAPAVSAAAPIVPVAPQPASPVASQPVVPVVSQAPAPAWVGPAPITAEPVVPQPLVAVTPTPDYGDIEGRIRALYATALEYPEEVFEADAELEADLGVDSVKQTELMTRVGELFELGPRPEGMRVGEYRTFGRVVQFVRESLPAAR
ncbi:acyltransferase domain-containing protein [Kutzneria sp. CA-103260]|uniref:acyltransferase domain-containing protein n=1 Tax=Kutzneria sp. CA-103260 TaxID=2802641 RepID=UPI001BA98055|nr:acyltransferase domain-containing protein [Kutzneria sp. CA-103260]QUQ63900.1 type I polyketide synthase [Kutzneria sp. CA-103260]